VVAIVHKLRSLHTVADMVVMVQVSATTSAVTLTKLEENIFRKLNISIVYLPKQPLPEMDTFYSLVVQGKFYILNLIEYSRVMFLDVDMFPRCNLDYLFELSEPRMGQVMDGVTHNKNNNSNPIRRRPYLKENIVLGWKHEPSNAGLFVLRPQEGAYDNVLQPIIDEKESRALRLPAPHWDPVEGWGHKIGHRDEDSNHNTNATPLDDYWVAPSGISGTNWSWAYAFADQGLLYYWTKYVQRSVSLITPGKIENWGTSSCASTVLCREEILEGVLETHSCRRVKREAAPYRDFFHFSGDRKPWWSNQTQLEQDLQQILTVHSGKVEAEAATYQKFNFRQKWYFHLKQALMEIDMVEEVLSLGFIGREEIPPVGRSSSLGQMYRYIVAKERVERETQH
jgi:hypothetical protein